MFKFFEHFISIPKSFYVSWRLLGFIAAFKLPIFVRYNVKLLSLRGRVDCDSVPCFSMMKIGFGNVGIFDKTFERTILQVDGVVHIKPIRGSVFIGHGSRICVSEKGNLHFGNNFVNTAMGSICCVDNITFGDNVLTSWNTLIMDTDWHSIQNIETEEVYLKTKPISVGSNVWIGTRAVLLKGSSIPDGCIVGANTTVTKKFDSTNSIIAGNPAKIVKENVRYIA